MNLITKSKRIVYEVLLKAWNINKGKVRFMSILTKALRIKPYGTYRPKTIGDYVLFLDPGDNNDRLVYFDIVGKAYAKLISELLRPGDNVIDVGANVGHFSVVCAPHVTDTGRVFAIEANSKLFQRLQLMVNNNQQGPIRAYHFAIWQSSGVIPFHVAKEYSGWSSIIENPTFTTDYTIKVSAISIDEFVDQNNIENVRILKLDIEGAETDALMGAKNLLISGTLDFILLETDPHRIQAFGHTTSEFLSLLDANGFVPIYRLSGERVIAIENGQIGNDGLHGDYLFSNQLTEGVNE